MKRSICSLVILLALVFTMAVPAFAAEEKLAVDVPVEVALEGPVLDSVDTFTVELSSDTDSAPMPAEASLKFDGAGSDKFVFEYSSVGVYSYKIRQIAGDNPDCTYDSTVYSLTVFVTAGENGEVETTTVLEDADGEKTDTARFVNKYAPPEPAKLDPPVEKKVVEERGSAPSDSVFTFAMIPGDKNAPMPENEEAELDPDTGTLTMKKPGPGSYEFGWMYFDEDDAGKTYTYTIKEVPGEDSKYTYDVEIYTMTVKVTSKDRKIELDVTYTDKDGNPVDKAVFTNIYRDDEKPEEPDEPVGPKTGDEMHLTTYVIMLVVSAAVLIALGVTMIIKKKKHN